MANRSLNMNDVFNAIDAELDDQAVLAAERAADDADNAERFAESSEAAWATEASRRDAQQAADDRANFWAEADYDYGFGTFDCDFQSDDDFLPPRVSTAVSIEINPVKYGTSLGQVLRDRLNTPAY